MTQSRKHNIHLTNIGFGSNTFLVKSVLYI